MTIPGIPKSWIFLGCCISLLDCASPTAANRPPEHSPGARPSMVATVSGPALWKSLAPGRETTLGVKADGSLWVWGWNREGGSDRRLEYAPHIDNGRPPVAVRPTRIGDDRNWASVSASDGAFMALKTDGTLWGWDREERQQRTRGEDENGENGEGAKPAAVVTPAFPLPQLLGTDTDWRQIAVTTWHTLALRSDGSLWGWGSNRDGELGDGTTEEHSGPVRIGKERWQTVVTEGSRSFGIRQDGTLWAWGGSVRGWQQEPKRTSSPLQLGGDAGWQQASCSSDHLLAVKADGTLWAYGGNQHGQLGIGSTVSPDPYVLMQVGRERDWAAVSAGEHFSLAVKSDGSLWAWGDNSRGQLGDGTTTEHTTPVPIAPSMHWRAAHAGEDHVVAEAMDGGTWTWGSNQQGQLGDGRTLVTLAPLQVQPGSKWRFIAGVQGYTLALRDDGAMWIWGGSKAGTFVKPAAEWSALALYRTSSVIGIQPDGSLWDINWHNGKLERINQDIFAESPGRERWTRVFANEHGVLAQDDQDGLWYFHRTQVSDRSTRETHQTREVWSPEPLGKSGEWGHAFAELSEGGVVVAQKKDGTFWLFEAAWDKSKKPILVEKRVAWESIAAGQSEILLLEKDGQLWRFDGQERERIGRSSGWAMASVSTHHTLAVRKDGSLWSWGTGEAGELGTVYAGEQPTPVRVGKDADWVEAAAAHDHSVGRKRDGSLWTWGNNLNGELGTGPALYREKPSRLELP